MNVVLLLHSYTRWIIIAFALFILVRSVLVLSRRLQGSAIDVSVMAGWGNLLGIQMLLGLTYLIWSGVAGAGVPLYRIGHLLVMFVAVSVGNVATRWKDADPSIRARNNLVTVLVVLALVLLGVSLLPGGASRWTVRLP